MKFFNQKQLAIALLCFLAFPFVFFTFLQVTGGNWFTGYPVSPTAILHSYGVLVVSFVAGIQWGVHFCKRTEDSVYLLSFFTLVLAWLSMYSPGTIAGLAILLIAFILSWVEEMRFSRQRVTTLWFWQVRSGSTLVIGLSLLMAIADLARS
jgi:hypothetical protein